MPYIEIGKSKLFYQKLGTGSKVLLGFHGFGQDQSYYSLVAGSLANEYTFYSFDLFFHGKSVLAKQDSPLTKKLLNSIITAFLQNEKIERFALMGFSMGGKFALTLLEHFYKQIDTVFLIAPDGIKTSFWYNVATYPGWLSGVFKSTVVRPKPFFNLVHTLHKLKAIDPGLSRFARFQMDRPAKRLKIYRSWTGFRLLQFNITEIVGLLNQEKIPVVLFFGTYDKVITAAGFNFFTRALERVKTIQLKTGHTHLLAEVGNYLKHHDGLLLKKS